MNNKTFSAGTAPKPRELDFVLSLRDVCLADGAESSSLSVPGPCAHPGCRGCRPGAAVPARSQPHYAARGQGREVATAPQRRSAARGQGRDGATAPHRRPAPPLSGLERFLTVSPPQRAAPEQRGRRPGGGTDPGEPPRDSEPPALWGRRLGPPARHSP